MLSNYLKTAEGAKITEELDLLPSRSELSAGSVVNSEIVSKYLTERVLTRCHPEERSDEISGAGDWGTIGISGLGSDMPRVSPPVPAGYSNNHQLHSPTKPHKGIGRVHKNAFDHPAGPFPGREGGRSCS